MTRTQWMVTGAIVLLGGLAVGAFFLSYKQEKKEVRVPPSGEARKNPYLALERLYTQMGLQTETANTAAEPKSGKAVGFLTDRRRNFTPKQVQKWVSWVEEGGHLILPAPPDEAEHVPLIEAFDIRRDESAIEALEDDAETPGASPDAGTTGDAGFQEPDGGAAGAQSAETSEKQDSEATAETPPKPVDATFVVDGVEDRLLRWKVSDVDWRAGTADGDIAAISRPVSRGRVTLVADPGVFENDELAKYQHASLAWTIATLDENAERQQSGGLIVLFSAQKSWMGYVASHAWPFFIGLGLILLFSLNAARWRFGPLLPEPPPNRRSRVEHIRATGEFVWEHEAAAELLEAARESLIAELARRRPSLADATGDRKRTIVAEMLDLDRDEVQLVFDSPASPSRSQFQKRIEFIEEYRREL